MIPSTLCAFVAVLSSLAAVNGAVVQRDGTFVNILDPATYGTGWYYHHDREFEFELAVVEYDFHSVDHDDHYSVDGVGYRAVYNVDYYIIYSVDFGYCSVHNCDFCDDDLYTTSSPTTTATTTATIPTTMSSAPSSTTPTITASVPITKSLTPTTTATAASGTVNCNGVQNWQGAFAYTAGDQVIFNGQLYTARQWTFNNSPPTAY
ncbi:hypothetical protein EV363DRAFT_1446013 [Boletus edulis]|nr:hypothetical protein EV363DRAFT_1446013 [Boletus edulis]